MLCALTHLWLAPRRYLQQNAQGISNDMGSVAESLEQELQVLNERYQDLLRLSAAEHGGASNPDRTLALEHILAQIERRGQQLYLLRKSQSEVQDASERSVLHSPDAAR
jgi:hypothetical protein